MLVLYPPKWRAFSQKSGCKLLCRPIVRGHREVLIKKEKQEITCLKPHFALEKDSQNQISGLSIKQREGQQSEKCYFAMQFLNCRSSSSLSKSFPMKTSSLCFVSFSFHLRSGRPENSICNPWNTIRYSSSLI